MSAPFVEVNAARSGRQLAAEFELQPAREKDKFACVGCSSSDGLHAYPGRGSGLFCWSCGSSFSAVDLGMVMWGMTALEACERLADRLGIRAPTNDEVPQRLNPGPSVSQVDQAVHAFRTKTEVLGELSSSLTLGPRGRRYLDGRGLSHDFAYVHGFRSIDTAAEWTQLAVRLRDMWSPEQLLAAGFPMNRGRLWLPWRGQVQALAIFYFGPDGREIHSVRFRRMTDGDRRYMALHGPGARTPWNAEAFEGPSPLEVVVVEGELDALSLLQEGYDAVALGGATPSRAVIDWIVDASADIRKLALWMDRGDAGDGAVHRLAGALAKWFGTEWLAERVVQWRSESDANDLLTAGAPK